MYFDVDGDRLIIRAKTGADGAEIAGVARSIKGYDYRLGTEGDDAVLYIFLKPFPEPMTVEDAAPALSSLMKQIDDSRLDVFLVDDTKFVPVKISDGKHLLVSARTPAAPA